MLHLTGKGSIWDAITGAAHTVANAAISGVRDVGDVGSYAAGAVTHNQQAQQNALNAIRNNNQNLSTRSIGANAAALGQDFVQGIINPVARPLTQFGVGLGADAYNAAHGTNLTGQQLASQSSAPWLINYGTNQGKVKNPGGIRELLGSGIETGVNALTLGKGKAFEQAAEQGLRGVTGNKLAGRVASRVLASGAVGAGAGAGYGTGQAVQDAQNAGDVLYDVSKGAETGAVAGGLVGGVTKVPDVARTARENAINLDEVGGINNPGISPEDSVHQNNPLNPPLPTEPLTPEPTASDLVAASKAAEQMDHKPIPIDFNQVEGAGQRLTQAVKDRADTLQQMEASLKGGVKQKTVDGGYVRSSEHSPFYRQVYEETGRKPTIAAWRQEAERQLQTGGDEESHNYQSLARHAEVEKELKAYQLADKQSGYNKVRTKNTAGQPRYAPTHVIEKITSPEYAAKKQSGAFLQKVRDELKPAKAAVTALDKQIQRLSKRGDINGITKLNEQNVQARLKLRVLEGLERAHGSEYGRLARQLDEKFPDTELRLKGKRSQTSVSGRPVSGVDKIVTVQGRRMTQSELEGGVMEGAIDPEQALQSYASPQARKYLENEVVKASGNPADQTGATPTVKTTPVERNNLEEILGHPLNHEPYTGPNLNEGAFEGFEPDSYSPEYDNTLPKETPEPTPRNLAGDEAAFNALKDGKPIDEAVKAYQEATGASEAQADEAVGRVAETGADLGTSEEILKRNPQYKQVDDFAVHDIKDVDAKVRGYKGVLDLKATRLDKAAGKLSDHDIELLDHLRGNPIEKVAAAAEDPARFTKTAELAKSISDYSHEIRRLNGDSTIYRENYGAGMHYSISTPEDIAAVSGYRDELASKPGFSNKRVLDNYDKAQQEYQLNRRNANLIEDVHNDIRQTLNYVNDRAAFRGIQDVYGPQAAHFGNPTYDQPAQLKGTRDVFTTRDIAKKWSELQPKDQESKVVRTLAKPYDAASSVVTQAIVVNPFIHGSNLLAQAYIAAGRMDPAGLRLGKGLALSKTEKIALDERRFQAGDHRPTYGIDHPGVVARMTKGVTDLNKRAMSAIDNDLRRALFKDLTDRGMSDREAVIQADKFMGDKVSIGNATRRFTLFFKFFKTMLGALGEQVKHPVKQSGTIVNTAIVAGAVYGLDKAFQEWLGNKHAHMHIPGELGIAKDLVVSGKDIAEGHYKQALGTATNRINPILKEGAQQLFNQDLFTGQDLSKTGRGSHAAQSLFPEAQTADRVQDDRKSAAEAAGNFLGFFTPHAKNAPAAPSGNADFLNKKTIQSNGQTIKVKNAKGEDPTGIDQQTAYFNSLEKAKSTLPAARQKVYDQITAAETDPNGNPVGANDKQTQARYASMYANPDVLKAIVKQKQEYAKKTGLGLDPLYSDKYTDEQRLTYLRIQAEPYKGDDYINETKDNASGKTKDWIRQLTADRVAFFATQDFAGAPASERVLPPKIDDATQADMDKAETLSGSDKAQFIDAHPKVQDAYDAIAKYTNDRRIAEGHSPFKLFPKADPATQATLNEFFGLPKGDGPKGGNKTERLWIQANPDKYAKVQNYLANLSEWELANSAGQDKFVGNTPSQQELKSAYSLGKYDIAVNKDANGNKVYSINPSSAYQQSSGGGGSGFSYTSGSGSGTTSQYKINRAARNYYNEQNRQHIPRIKTISQNRRFLDRKVNTRYLRTKKAAKTGKLRIKSATS